MLTTDDYSRLIERFEASAQRLPFRDAEVVIDHYRDVAGAVFPTQAMSGRLVELLSAKDVSTFAVRDLRRAVAGQLIGQALGHTSCWAGEMHLIAGHFVGGSAMVPPSAQVWDEAADLGRALLILVGHAIKEEELRWPRELATAAAARRLKHAGYAISMIGADLFVPQTAVQQVTARLQALLGGLGLVDSVGNLLLMMDDMGLLLDGIYVAGRKTGAMRTEPGLPCNLLLQLAVRTTSGGTLPLQGNARADAWSHAVQLATDLTTVLEVETWGWEVLMGEPPGDLIRWLRDIGLFDALFSFRQWPIEHSEFILTSFYEGVDDAAFLGAAGWGFNDGFKLLQSVEKVSVTNPTYFDRADLIRAGANSQRLDALLGDAAHPLGSVNKGLSSPLDRADLMFRPLVEVKKGVWTQLASSLVGPALFEVFQARLRTTISCQEMSDLSGTGTERAAAALFARAGMDPEFAGAKYDMGADCDGECDLVFTDDESILFVEAKAKPLGRATQTGRGHAALLDLAGGMLAGQLQAIGHERVLRQCGRLSFVDGGELLLRNRSVYRLSVTLLDHAGLNDRMLMPAILGGMMAKRFETVPETDGSVRRQVGKLNKMLQKARADIGALSECGFDYAIALKGPVRISVCGRA